VKLAPVIHALRRRGLPVVLVATGQHPELAPAMLREAGLTADVDLGVSQPGATPPQLLAAILTYLAPVYAAYRPQLALVQGDTVSAFAGALGASYARVPVAHVEAGLRTGDQDEPFPEELHRQLIAPLASLHFAPTRRAALALRREGVEASAIHITGNSGLDALRLTLERLQADPGLRATLDARFPFVREARRPLILVTAHRRENIGRRMGSIVAALARLAAFCEAEIVVPLHPNPDVRRLFESRLGALDGVHLVPPLDHTAMVWLMQRSRLLMTDSGGLQEEAPSLGLRTLVLRSVTERPEAILAGAAELVDLHADTIVRKARLAVAKPAPAPVHPFGDGHAAGRIAAHIDSWLGIPNRRAAALSLSA
jgi:UDP-N-acetylglucosamine 2-epimerase (non-hydrolysing)